MNPSVTSLGRHRRAWRRIRLEVAVEAVAGARGEGADAEGAVGDVAVDGVAAGRRDAHPVGAAAAGAHRAHLEPAHQPPPAPPLHAAVQERLTQPRRPRRSRIAAALSRLQVAHTKQVNVGCRQPTNRTRDGERNM